MTNKILIFFRKIISCKTIILYTIFLLLSESLFYPRSPSQFRFFPGMVFLPSSFQTCLDFIWNNTFFIVLLVLLFIRDVRSKWIMLIKRAMSINTRRLLYEKGYFSRSFSYYSFLSCHQYTLLILNCLLSHLPSTLSFITQKEIDSMCLFIKA